MLVVERTLNLGVAIAAFDPITLGDTMFIIKEKFDLIMK